MKLKTLPLACCGIVLGSALAFVSGAAWHNGIFFSALLTAVLLQILANLANDYGDFTKHADTPERLGPIRGLQTGMILPEEMKKALWLTTLLTILAGSVLMKFACNSLSDALIFLCLGGISIVAALTYTVGRYAYGYFGLGDLSVLIFFGWVAVVGSFYLQTHQFDAWILIPATACGLLSVVVLNVNNMRDIQEDLKSGKITLVVRLGERWARYYHMALLVISIGFLVWSAYLFGEKRPWVWLFLLATPFFFCNARATFRSRTPGDFRPQLAIAVKISIVALGGFALGLSIN